MYALAINILSHQKPLFQSLSPENLLVIVIV